MDKSDDVSNGKPEAIDSECGKVHARDLSADTSAHRLVGSFTAQDVAKLIEPQASSGKDGGACQDGLCSRNGVWLQRTANQGCNHQARRSHFGRCSRKGWGEVNKEGFERWKREMTDAVNNPRPNFVVLPPDKVRKYALDGTLKDMGYTDEQIKEALELVGPDAKEGGET